MKLEAKPFNLGSDFGWFHQHNPIFIVSDLVGIVFWCNGRRVAAALFDQYTGVGGSLQGHFVITNSMVLRNGFIETCAGYCFEYMGCGIVYAQVPSTNTKALKFNKHLGFKEMARLPNAFPDADAIILGMRREDCEYLG